MRAPSAIHATMIALALLGTLATTFPAQTQSGARVLAIEIPSLVPFAVSFDVEIGAATASPDVRGTVTLSDPSGREVDQFPIAPFSIPVGGRAHVGHQLGHRTVLDDVHRTVRPTRDENAPVGEHFDAVVLSRTGR